MCIVCVCFIDGLAISATFNQLTKFMDACITGVYLEVGAHCGDMEETQGKKLNFARCAVKKKMKYCNHLPTTSPGRPSDRRLTSELETLCVKGLKDRAFTFDICSRFPCR